MIGMGLGGGTGGFGGTNDYVTTVVRIVGGEQIISWQRRFVTGWNSVDRAQRNASRSGAMMSRIGFGLNALEIGLAAVAIQSVRMANNVIESEQRVAVVFGRNTQRIVEWSKQRQKAFGTNPYEERNTASTFAVQFKAGGFDANKMRDYGKTFTEIRDDLVSFYDVANSSEVGDALTSGLTGQIRPLRRFGLYLSDATIKAYAYAHGIARVGEKLTDQQKIQARVGVIIEQYNRSSAKGDLARTINSPANQLRRLRNERDTAMVDFGKSLIPVERDLLSIGNKILPIFGKAVGWFAGLSENTRKWAVYLLLARRPLMWMASKGLSWAYKKIFGKDSDGSTSTKPLSASNVFMKANNVFLKGPVYCKCDCGGGGGNGNGGGGSGTGGSGSGAGLPSGGGSPLALPGGNGAGPAALPAGSPPALPPGSYGSPTSPFPALLPSSAVSPSAPPGTPALPPPSRPALPSGAATAADDAASGIPAIKVNVPAAQKVSWARRVFDWLRDTSFWENKVVPWAMKNEGWLRPGLNRAAGAARVIGKVAPWVVGASAGYDAYDDYRTLGYGKKRSMAGGVGTGVATGLGMLIGGALPILVAQAVHYGINRWYNNPMEAAAEGGTGPTDAENTGLKNQGNRQKADFYNRLAVKAYEGGDETSATSFRYTALSFIKRDKQRQAQLAQAQQQVDYQRTLNAMVQQPRTVAPFPGLTPEQSALARQYGIDVDSNLTQPTAPSVKLKARRDNSDNIHIQGTIGASQADRDARRMRFITSTPSPAF